MQKPALTVRHLTRSGFRSLGCWELSSSNDLVHAAIIPTDPGVYAFAIDGIVQYVGLASRSVQKRFNFYRKPSATQRTSIRLNELIRDNLRRGTIVEILVSHPSNFEWNGLPIRGTEGLEAGLIAAFDLPWNLRGASPSFGRRPTEAGASAKPAPVHEKILALVERRPGMTELEIAKELFGPDAIQQNVNSDCRFLLSLGLVQRDGEGGRVSPYTYRRANNLSSAAFRAHLRQSKST